ncbi:MAG: S8 family serine peptidase [Thermoanaerobaculum sp.]|nr:S8 family serine peptidase [Thermoanaerobaculum sp.]MDW7968311.1 S8 family serine peptidase [Thermoanaerobaculum sp.]
MMLVTILCLATVTVAAPPQGGEAWDKISPALWAEAAKAAQGLVEVIVTLHLPASLAEESGPFARPRLMAIDAASQEVAREVQALGGRVLERYTYIPALAAVLPATALVNLASHPQVQHLGHNFQVQAFDAEGEALMQVPQVRQLGWTGRNVGIAILDTGVNYNHPELSPGGNTPSAKTIRLWDAVNNDPDPMDDAGHGTSVASVAAGKTLGVAREAWVVAVKVLDANGSGRSRQIISGINKILESINNGNPFNIKVANLSLGGYDSNSWPPGQGTCDSLDPATFGAFESLRQAGVLVVVAAGNGGCTNGVAWPACLSNALAVGATYDDTFFTIGFGKGQCTPSGCVDSMVNADDVTCYSDSGEKLDVWAPGSETLAARGSAGQGAFHGTSAAAPYVAGVAGLLSQAVPQRTSEALYAALRNTGKPVTDRRNNITRNRVDAVQALQALQGGGSSSTSFAYYVTGIARWPGFPPAFWYSDLAMLNPSTSVANVKLSFLSSSQSLTPVEFQLQGKAQAAWRDVLATAFNFTGQAVGAILVESSQKLRVLARTYSQVQVKQQDDSLAWGTMGQFIEGQEVSQALTSGKVGYLVNLRSDPPFRTNVEFVNLGEGTVQVEVRFLANNGTSIALLTLDVPSQRRVQVGRALPDGHQAAYAEVRVLTAGGKVIGIASVVDGNSTDPTTIPLWIP